MNSLPVTYKSQKNAWVNTTIFLSWFHDVFVPDVQTNLQSMGLQPKALLILDNCSAHPDEDSLVSADGFVTTKYLPPNVTSLIQPMDQGVLESLKRRYRKSLLRDILLSEDVVKFIKSVNMKVVIEKIALSWNEITPLTIRRSWRKLLPLEDSPTMEDTMDDGPANSEFMHDFLDLGHDLDETEITEWLESDFHDQGCEHLDDDAIVDLFIGTCSDEVQEVDSDDNETVDEPCPVSHRDAAVMLNKCLTWLQHQPEATPCNLSVLLSLKGIAAKKRYSSMKQITITSFLSKP